MKMACKSLKNLKLGARQRSIMLKQSLVLLFLLMRQTGDGKILTIQVRHGLPVTVEIERLRNR
jgi:hypothetical protein